MSLLLSSASPTRLRAHPPTHARTYARTEQDNLIGKLSHGVDRLKRRAQDINEESQLHTVSPRRTHTHLGRVLVRCACLSSCVPACLRVQCVALPQRLLDNLDNDVDGTISSLKLETQHATKVCFWCEGDDVENLRMTVVRVRVWERRFANRAGCSGCT